MELEIIEKEFKFLENPNSKNHLYRIKNNFIAFYYHFVWNNQAARVLMSGEDFYDTFIKDDLEQFVSLRFKKIGEQYLIRKYQSRNNEPLMNIGRYWYNDRKSRADVEIDVCVQTKKCIHVYECKWTNDRIGESIMHELIEKGKYLGANKYGAFSRNGYHDHLLDQGYDLVTLEDLFQ